MITIALWTLKMSTVNVSPIWLINNNIHTRSILIHHAVHNRTMTQHFWWNCNNSEMTVCHNYSRQKSTLVDCYLLMLEAIKCSEFLKTTNMRQCSKFTKGHMNKFNQFELPIAMFTWLFSTNEIALKEHNKWSRYRWIKIIATIVCFQNKGGNW